MARALKEILEGNEGYRANTKDEARFKAKHKIAKHKDRNGNDDKHFRASNIKPYKKSLEHGYDWPKDEKVYEEIEIDEGHGMFSARFYGWKTGEDDGNTYKVVRFHKKGGSKTIKKGLTLGQARSHCEHKDTSSSTCTAKHAKAYTRRHGDWFDGYDIQRRLKEDVDIETEIDEASTWENFKSGRRAAVKKKLKEKGEKKRTDNAREYWGNLKGAQNADKEAHYAKKYGGEKAARTQKELSRRMHKAADDNIKQARVGGRWVERGENLRKTRNYMKGKK